MQLFIKKEWFHEKNEVRFSLFEKRERDIKAHTLTHARLASRRNKMATSCRCARCEILCIRVMLVVWMGVWWKYMHLSVCACVFTYGMTTTVFRGRQWRKVLTENVVDDKNNIFAFACALYAKITVYCWGASTIVDN